MDPLPPETTTPMPPQLHLIAPRLFPPNTPTPKLHLRPRTKGWDRFIAKMSAPTDSVQP